MRSLIALAVLCAMTIVVASPSAASDGDPVISAAPVSSPNPAAAGDKFTDVPSTHWAYPALQQLQADGIVEGYPGGYFKGNRPLTRYEMAAITARAVKRLESMLAEAQTAQRVNSNDIAAVRKLIDEYGDQLKAVQKDVAAVKEQVAAVKSQVGVNTAALDRQQFHLTYFLRAPGAYSDNVEARSAGGAVLPAGASVIGPDMGGGPQQLTNGGTAHGTGFQVARLLFSGNVDPKVSYQVRLEDRYYLDNTVGNGGRFGDSTSSVTPGAGNFPNNGLFRMNLANLTYKDPSGLYGQVGRFTIGTDTLGTGLGLAFRDYFNGLQVGVDRPRGVSGFVGYGFNKASNSNVAPYTGLSSQTVFARLVAPVGSKTKVGASYINDLAFSGGGPTVFNPATLRYQQVATNLAVGSLDFRYAPTSFLALNAEYMRRFGNNPVTGGGWTEPTAVWVQGTFGRLNKTGSNYANVGYIDAGANSTTPHTEIEGTTDYQQFYINNPNGYHIGYIGLHHFFSDRAQIGLIYQAYGLKTFIPIDSYSFGTGAGRVTTPCLGCSIKRDDGRALFLQTQLSF